MEFICISNSIFTGLGVRVTVPGVARSVVSAACNNCKCCSRKVGITPSERYFFVLIIRPPGTKEKIPPFTFRIDLQICTTRTLRSLRNSVPKFKRQVSKRHVIRSSLTKSRFKNRQHDGFLHDSWMAARQRSYLFFLPLKECAGVAINQARTHPLIPLPLSL